MIIIEETTIFDLPIDVVFDAERNISLHSATQSHRGEKAISGVTSGLIDNGQEVEWEAIHFRIKQRLRVRITHMKKPEYFRDEMVFGAFKSFSHEHIFKMTGPRKTEKRDIMHIEAPLGSLGILAEVLFLEMYMRAFIKRKNQDLKRLIEKERY